MCSGVKKCVKLKISGEKYESIPNIPLLYNLKDLNQEWKKSNKCWRHLPQCSIIYDQQNVFFLAYIKQACDEKLVEYLTSWFNGIYCADYGKISENIPSPPDKSQIPTEIFLLFSGILRFRMRT